MPLLLTSLMWLTGVELLSLEGWTPQGGSPPAGIEDGKLILPIELSPEMERCYWDREVKLDLSTFGRFVLRMEVENRKLIRSATIYFRSGEGWFGAWFTVGEGMNEISLNKADFRQEGNPSGWRRIDGIRISFWKGSEGKGRVVLESIEAVRDEILIVRGNLSILKGSPEAESVRRYAELMAKLLREAGLEFGVVEDTDVEDGALRGCRIAIFPYNPDISEREAEEIERFIRDGGKVIIFYSIPPRIARLLGVEITGWMRQEYEGQFASAKLRTTVVEGFPLSIGQGSWNVRLIEPVDPEAEVAGEWIDSKGEETGIPAITVHPNGAVMGHVLTAADPEDKKRMLIALIGKLVPEMRPELLRAYASGAAKLGWFETIEEVAGFIESNLKEIPAERAERARRRLEEARAAFGRLGEIKGFGEAIEAIDEARALLEEAFFLSFPSRKGEFRAVWCHSAFGVPGWSWDEAIKHLAENGFNAIFPNMLWGGLAYYPSEVLPVAEEVGERGDQVKECLEACRRYGVQIHVWKVNWNLGGRAPESFVEKLRSEGRLQRDRFGNEVGWLCPSHPENFKLELESMLEIVRGYPVDGIHFDYIRYPHANACYCEGCRKRFEEETGAKVERWPEDVIEGDLAERFAEWRRERITRLVREVSRRAREIRPGIKISAAVFRNYPTCRERVGQDWKLWIEKGYLDFVCPMDYTNDIRVFEDLVRRQVEIVGGKAPLYVGIGASAPGLRADQVAMQIHLARKLGADGFIIFNYDLHVAEEILPKLRLGLTAEE